MRWEHISSSWKELEDILSDDMMRRVRESLARPHAAGLDGHQFVGPKLEVGLFQALAVIPCEGAVFHHPDVVQRAGVMLGIQVCRQASCHFGVADIAFADPIFQGNVKCIGRTLARSDTRSRCTSHSTFYPSGRYLFILKPPKCTFLEPCLEFRTSNDAWQNQNSSKMDQVMVDYISVKNFLWDLPAIHIHCMMWLLEVDLVSLKSTCTSAAPPDAKDRRNLTGF